MILVENSPFGPSPDQTEYTTSYHSPFEAYQSSEISEPLIDLDDLDQLILNESLESEKASNISDYCDTETAEVVFEDEEDYKEDLNFLEIDLSASSSVKGRVDEDFSSLTPSVQRLFSQTSMSNYSRASSAVSSILDDCYKLRSTDNSASGTLAIAAEDQALYSIKSSPAVAQFGNTGYDSISSYSGCSNTSSAPSTPSSIVGCGGASSQTFSYHPTSAATAAAATGVQLATLPSFNEIYSPQKFKSKSHHHHHSHNHQNCFDCTAADIFKFEDYISESESEAENNSCAGGSCVPASKPIVTSLASVATTTAAAATTLHPLVLKEEPMDTFLPAVTTTSTTAPPPPSGSTNLETTFITHHDSLLARDDSFERLLASKIDTDNDYSVFIASSPKPLREHMTNLSSLSLSNSNSSHFEQHSFGEPDQASQPQSSNPVPSLVPFDPRIASPNTVLPTNISLLINPTSANPSVVSEPPIYRSKSRNQRHKLSQMQTCAVCGDVAACQHYGVLTCEGCKGFFKRTVQKSSKYNCLGNQDCTVDKRRRNRCQFCRFKKCLAVGMVKEVVRTDNLKGRRGRLPSKPKSPQEQPIAPPMSTIAALVKAYEETSADNANLDFSKFYENIEERIQMDNQMSDYINQQILYLLSNSLDTLVPFVEKIPGFNELNENDKRLLFQNSSLELFALRMAYRRTPGTNFVILCNNIVLHRKQFAHTFGEWLPMIEELSNQLYAMKIDVNAFACLCALTVITGRHGVQDSAKIDQLETKITNSLKDHTVYNSEAQKKSNYFSRILSKLAELRTIGEIGYRSVMAKLSQLPTEFITSEIYEMEKKISPKNETKEVKIGGGMQKCHDLPSMTTFPKFTESWSQVN